MLLTTKPDPTLPWRERYYHITDPDGHEISFAQTAGTQG